MAVEGLEAQVLVEQTAAVSPERLGDLVGRVTHQELDDIVRAVKLVHELD